MATDFYNKKILLVDDDESILSLLETILHKEGYQEIYKAVTGETAVKLAEKFSPDIIILDVMLPDIDGYEVCQSIRTHSMAPVLFLSARSDEVDKLISYKKGGDEYMTKPFRPRELLAKINAILTRQDYYAKCLQPANQFSFGAFTIDMDKKVLLLSGRNVPLTAKEYALLEYLIINRNITLSKEQLIEHVWDCTYEGYDNTVMVHIRHLREKIEEDPSSPKYIKTIKGRGYLFETV